MEDIDSEYPDTQPHPHIAALYILHLCTAQTSLTCEMRFAVFQKAEVKNAECSTGLYPSLPAAGNQHHATSCGRGLASQHNTLQHLFFFAGWRKVGGVGGGIYRVAFIELLQSIQRIYEPCGPLKAAQPGNCMTGALQYYEYPPCILAVKSRLYSKICKEPSYSEVKM